MPVGADVVGPLPSELAAVDGISAAAAGGCGCWSWSFGVGTYFTKHDVAGLPGSYRSSSTSPFPISRRFSTAASVSSLPLPTVFWGARSLVDLRPVTELVGSVWMPVYLLQ